MNDLIKALTIFAKYANDDYNPTHCEHDMFYIGCEIEPDNVTDGDKKELSDLGFNYDLDGFYSYRFGSY